MLKTRIDDSIWLVHQPDHARVSGYLAAHWGNERGFSRPGEFAPSEAPEVIRREVVRAIAEHDNGWWEWEASPNFDPADGLPLGMMDLAHRYPEESLDHWRRGVPRLADKHPYAALLVSMHAYWLHAFRTGDALDSDEAFRHPLFSGQDSDASPTGDVEPTRRFLGEQQKTQTTLLDRLRGEPLWASAVEPANLGPHFKLLQVLDAISLLLCFGSRSEADLPEIPRSRWDERVTLSWRPAGRQRVICAPYPFDADPLQVVLPVRIVPGDTSPVEPFVSLHATPLQTVRFELSGA